MKTTAHRSIAIGIVVGAVAGCATDSGDRSETRTITESNALGVTEIRVETFGDSGDHVFQLRATGADDHEVGSIRVRTGTIADLRTFLPHLKSDEGSEIIVTVGGKRSRMVTREMRRFRLSALTPEAEQLAQIGAVAQALSEANIMPPPRVEANERMYGVANCDPNHLLLTPVANQCCYTEMPYAASPWSQTLFINATNHTLVSRFGNGARFYNHPACKASDGTSACSGSDCYFGPFGFDRPVVSASSDAYYPPDATFHDWLIAYDDYGWGENSCTALYAPYTEGPLFPPETGALPSGVGCPGGDSGDGEWDY